MSHGLTNSQLETIRSWHWFNSKILKFMNQANVHMFEQIFFIKDEDGVKLEEQPTPSEGYRLFQHFRFKCDHDYQKFTTYLTVDQQNDLLVFLVKYN